MTKKLFLILLISFSILSSSCGRKAEDNTNNSAPNYNEEEIIVEISSLNKQNLFNLIKGGDYNLISQELSNHSFLEYHFENGETPLIRSIKLNAGRPDIVNLLIAKTKDINFRDLKGHSPFEYALVSRNRTRLKKDRFLIKLITEGADYNIKTGSQEELQQFLTDSSLVYTKNLISKINKLSEQEISLNLINSYIREGEENLLTFLINTNPAAQAIIQTKNVILAAIDIKLEGKKKKIIQLLEEAGTKVDLTDPEYPLIQAARMNDRYTFIRLSSLKIDFFYTDEHGHTPIYYAVKNLNKDMVERSVAKARMHFTPDEFKKHILKACQALYSVNLRQDFPDINRRERSKLRVQQSLIKNRVLNCYIYEN